MTGGEKDEGDHDHLESLSRPVSGERSSHDDNESVGSVRPGSAASSNITGKPKSKRIHCGVRLERPEDGGWGMGWVVALDVPFFKQDLMGLVGGGGGGLFFKS